MRLCFCKQKTAYEMRISDWSSDVCSSDLVVVLAQWQLVSLHEVPVSPSIQVSQPFGPAWGEFGPLPVASLQETATEDADASGQARHDSTSGGKAFPEAIVMHVTRGLLPVGVPVAQQPSRCHGVDPQDRPQAVGEGSGVRRPSL